MMNKLSKREKNMVVLLLAVVVIMALVFFVVKPIMDTASSNKAIIADLEAQMTEAEAAVALKPIVAKKLADAVETINTEGATFYNPMQTWEAERIVSKFLYDTNVVYHSMQIEGPINFQKPPAEGEQIPNPTEIPKTGVQELKLVVECHTHVAQYNDLLDELYKLKQKGCISEWRFEGSDDVPKGPNGEIGMKAIVTFVLYTIE